MNPVSRVIFDTLAAGRGVNLPGVGSLYVERDAAKFISKNEIRPPHNRVLFSRKQNEDFDSVIDLIAGGGDRAAAEKEYNTWLEKAKGEKGMVEINEVGVLKHDFFYPSAALHDTLNPGGQKSVRLKSGSSAGRKVLIASLIVVCVAVVAGFAYSLVRYLESHKIAGAATEQTSTGSDNAAALRGESTIAATVPSEEYVPEEKAKPAETNEDIIQRHLEQYAEASGEQAPEAAPEESQASGQEVAAASEQLPSCCAPAGAEEVKPNLWQRFLNLFRCKGKEGEAIAQTDVERIEVPTESLDNAAATDEGAKPVTSSQARPAGQPMYHVVAGVYAIPRNADNLIAGDHLLIGSGTYKKLPYKDGKIMVVAYSSADHNAALRRLRQLRKYDYDLWIYAEE